jgi:hypothetical protein
MTVRSAFGDGIRRVARAPAVLAGAWLTMLALAAPLAVYMRHLLDAHLGASLAAESLARGVNWDWWQEFTHQASGLGTTFTPSILGFAAVLANVSHLADNTALHAGLAGLVAVWLAAWSFLSGGILDRYARQRPTMAAGFFSACGTHFFRFLRLGVFALLAYGFLFAVVHGWLFERLYPVVTRDFMVERSAFFARALLYALFAALLVALNLLLDYARIRIVVEDRRSAIGALLASGRFVWRHLASTAGLYLLLTAAFIAVAVLYALASPDAAAPAWLVLLVGQLYIVARLGTKLLFYAAQTAFFQSRLAHAEYVATSVPEWPESPAAEALDPPVARP